MLTLRSNEVVLRTNDVLASFENDVATSSQMLTKSISLCSCFTKIQKDHKTQKIAVVNTIAIFLSIAKAMVYHSRGHISSAVRLYFFTFVLMIRFTQPQVEKPQPLIYGTNHV